MSVYANPNEQGTVLGAAQAIGALGRTAGPPLIGTVYDVVSPVTSFLLAGGMMLLTALAGFGLAPVPQQTASNRATPLPDPPPTES